MVMRFVLLCLLVLLLLGCIARCRLGMVSRGRTLGSGCGRRCGRSGASGSSALVGDRIVCKGRTVGAPLRLRRGLWCALTRRRWSGGGSGPRASAGVDLFAQPREEAAGFDVDVDGRLSSGHLLVE